MVLPSSLGQHRLRPERKYEARTIVLAAIMLLPVANTNLMIFRTIICTINKSRGQLRSDSRMLVAAVVTMLGIAVVAAFCTSSSSSSST